MITIKKYANRRLYDVNSSSYITLSQLSEMVRQGQKIKVLDARSGRDLTRPTLVQVILEIEQEGHQMLPVEVLSQIIAAYKSPIEPLLSRYLERTMASFIRLHPLASQALETSLDAISQNHCFASDVATNGPTEMPVQKLAENEAIMKLREEVQTMKDRLKSIEG